MMEDYHDRIMGYHLDGLCCAQVLLQMGLDEKGSENPELIRAVKGLCGGLYAGLDCGALTGGACLLSLLCPDDECQSTVSALTEWFKSRYETVTCSELIGDDPDARYQKCPQIVTGVYEKVKELLEYD